MGVLQAVSQVATDVVDTAKTAATTSAQQIAKTPLDILEELLGQSPAPGNPEQKAPEEQAQQSTVDPAQMQQKAQDDDAFKVQQHQQLHSQILQESQGYYEQKKQMEVQQKQAEDKQKEQEKFQIKQLEKSKSQDYAVQAAQDAANAEKSRNVGAG